MKKTEATDVARQSTGVGLTGQAPRDMAMATGSNRLALGLRPPGVAEGGGDEEEMADVDEAEESAGVARDITMAETETATRTTTDTESETEMGALATND